MKVGKRASILIDLDDIIYNEGLNYLFSHRFDVEQRLLTNKDNDELLVKMFIYCLDFDIQNLISGHLDDKKFIADIINRVTHLNKDKCYKLADIYMYIFGYKALIKRRDLKECGLNVFTSSSHNFVWNGYSSYGDKYYSIFYKGTMKGYYQVVDANKVKNYLKKELEENPFFSNERIEHIFNEIIINIADQEFDEYIHCDDYYEPCIDDLAGEFSDRLNCALEKYGIEIYGEDVNMEEER